MSSIILLTNTFVTKMIEKQLQNFELPTLQFLFQNSLKKVMANMCSNLEYLAKLFQIPELKTNIEAECQPELEKLRFYGFEL